MIHCLKKGNTTNWIWIIVFLPWIGGLIYLFSEILTARQIRNFQSGIGEVISPSGSIRKLEDNLRFSDTFQNRILLADALLANNQVEKAVELYESSLTGAFIENEYVLSRLIQAYYIQKRYQEVLSCVSKIYNKPQFQNSKAHIICAMTLADSGQLEKAEKEFLKMKIRFSNFEARFYYARFLHNNNRNAEAKNILYEIVDEFPRLSNVEKRETRQWYSNAKEYLKSVA